jgi:hypothetical protein
MNIFLFISLLDDMAVGYYQRGTHTIAAWLVLAAKMLRATFTVTGNGAWRRSSIVAAAAFGHGRLALACCLC